MKHLTAYFALLLTFFALVSCGGRDGDGPEAPAMSHSEIVDGVVSETTAMMEEMAKITDVASAEAYAEKVEAIKVTLKEYLEAAQDLPAPVDEEVAAFQEKMDAAMEEVGPSMMAMKMGLSQNPGAEDISKILESLEKDTDMDELMEKLEAIYSPE